MKKNKLLLLLLAFVSFTPFAQNGWTKKKNSFYLQLAASTFSSNNYYNLNGQLNNGGSTFLSHGLLFYGEYGVTDRFNVLLDVPLLMVNHFNTTDAVFGLGNLKASLKYRLLKNFPFSAQIDIEMPTDDGLNFATSKEPDLLGNYDQVNLPTSDGEFNFWTTLVASQSTKSGKTFGGLYGSFNLRTKGFSPQIQAGMEIGHLFFNKLYLIGKFKIQEKVDLGNGPGGSFLYGEGTTFSQYTINALFKADDHWKVVAGFSDFLGFPIKRRNMYDGFTFFLGASIEY